MNIENHPCFNTDACKSFGRIHLPVAPRCNMQCKFCNRKFDCVNETRPGVTSKVLTPDQAMAYLKEAFAARGDISVVGIAGPGDPFANPDKTLETLNRVRSGYPDTILCVATNGLELSPYIDDLDKLEVSHVTVTVNAVDPSVSSRIYSWMRVGKKVLRSGDGSAILLERQLEGIRELKARGIIVKVNSIIIPGINEEHIQDVARQMADIGVDLFNCMPYYPNAGSAFENLEEPDRWTVEGIRKKAGRYIRQMRHCRRCRSDAVGLLGEDNDKGLMNRLIEYGSVDPVRPEKSAASHLSRAAVASREGVLINQHLGEAEKLYIYEIQEGRARLLEARATPLKGGGMKRWEEVTDLLSDCSTLLVNGIGDNPQRVITDAGIRVMEIEGLIEEALRAVHAGDSLNHMARRTVRACGNSCGGNGMGCG